MANIAPSPLERGKRPWRPLLSRLMDPRAPTVVALSLYRIGADASKRAMVLDQHHLYDLASRVRAWGKEAIAISAAITAWHLTKRRGGK